jgi:2-dehydropantoate 2-reductase
MNITVVGAGGIGSAIAAYLYRAGHDVSLVFKDKDDARAVREKGIRVFGRDTFSARVRVLECPAVIPASDLLIVAVKSFDTAEALATAVNVPIGMAISVQNGLQKEALIRKKLSDGVVVGSVIQLTAVNRGGGNIFHPGLTPSFVGEISGAVTERCVHLARTLTTAGIPTDVNSDIKSIEWTKMCQWVSTSLLAVMTGSSYSTMFGHGWLMPLFVELVRECAAVAQADGANVFSAPGLFVRDVISAKTEGACSLVSKLGTELQSDWKDYRASMLLDIERGVRTEFDDIVGYVTRKAAEHRIDTPALQFAIRQVSRYLPS